jgi:hypothetical protein
MSDNKISQVEYWRQIKAIAKDCKREAKEKGQSKDAWEERANELVHETVDGHMWIIYTWCYPWVLMHTRNEDALFEDFGPTEAKDYSSIMQKMAYCAMEKDVLTELSEQFGR